MLLLLLVLILREVSGSFRPPRVAVVEVVVASRPGVSVPLRVSGPIPVPTSPNEGSVGTLEVSSVEEEEEGAAPVLAEVPEPKPIPPPLLKLAGPACMSRAAAVPFACRLSGVGAVVVVVVDGRLPVRKSDDVCPGSVEGR